MTDSIQSNSTPVLLPEHRDHLRESGLSDETIAKAKTRSITSPEEARRLLGWKSGSPPVPAICFPFPGTDYCQLRADEPRKKGNDFVKYEGPVGRKTEAYVPSKDLCPSLDDVRSPLFLTEGVKKALAGCQAGLAIVAATGVSNFHEKTEDKEAPRSLKQSLIPLVKGRDAVIAFDSDIDNKPQVFAAAVSLAAMIKRAGGNPRITFIEPTGDKKVGLDDLMVMHGQESLPAILLDASRPTDRDEVIDWLKARWKSWDDNRRERELSRVMPFVSRMKKEKRGAWQEKAAKKIHITKSVLRRSLREWKTKASLASGSKDWLDAPGYIVKEGRHPGVHKLDREGDLKQIAPAPINVVGTCVDEGGHVYSSVRFKFGNAERTLTFPRSQISGQALLDLSAFGAPITQANCGAMQTFLQNQEQHNLGRLPNRRALTRSGYSDDNSCFVLGNRVIGASDVVVVRPGCESITKALVARGSREKYDEILQAVISRSPVAEMCAIASFVAPLLKPLGSRSIGYSVWCESAKGKSASQKAGIAGFGKPSGLTATGNSTVVGLSAMLTELCDLPMIFDETKLARNPEVLENLAYTLGGDATKVAGTRSGELRKADDFKSAMVINGEHQFLGSFAAAGSANRIFEVHAEPFDDIKFAQRIHQECAVNYGHAAPVIIQVLLRNYLAPNKSHLLTGIFEEFERTLDPERSEKAKQAAMLAVASSLVRQYELGETEGDAQQHALAMAKACFRLAMHSRKAIVDTVIAGYEALTDYFLQNEKQFNEECEHGRPSLGKVIDPCEMTGGRRAVAFLRRSAVEALKPLNFNFDQVMTGLKEKGLLVVEAGRNQRTMVFSRTTVKMYVLILPEEGAGGPHPDGHGGTDGGSDFSGEGGRGNAPPVRMLGQTNGVTKSIEGNSEVDAVTSQSERPFELVCDTTAVTNACEFLSTHRDLALDCETYPAPGHEHEDDAALDPFRNRIRLIQVAAEVGPVYIFDMQKLGALPDPLRQILSNREVTIIGFKLSFDVKVLMHHCGVEIASPMDLYAASVLAAGYDGFQTSGVHTLQAVLKRHLNIEISKVEAGSDWGASSLSIDQLRYASKDVALLHRLADGLAKEVTAKGVEGALALENSVIAPFADMELAGFGVDRDRLEALASTIRLEVASLEAEIKGVLGDCNLRSHLQLKDRLASIGVKVPSTGEEELEKHAAANPVVAQLLRHRRKKTITDFVKTIMTASERDGRVHSSFRSLGAATGRTSCSKPNIQSISRDERCRACFAAAPGKALVIADYSAIELRIIADQIGVKGLRECFCADPQIDPHRRAAAQLRGKRIEEVTKEERQRAKAINFGFVYGMSAGGFVKFARGGFCVELTEREAAEMRERYFAMYPEIRAWHSRAAIEGPRTGMTRTASGRLRYHRKDKGRFPLNNYINTPIQGTCADGIKRALVLLHPRLKALGARVVNMVHDEIVVETPNAVKEETMRVVVAAMKDGMAEFVKNVPIDVEAVIKDVWIK